MNPNFNNKENLNTNTVIPVEKTDDWLSMSEAAHHTPYSAEYLSLLARKRKLVSKKIGNAWYTTKSVLNDYMKKQMMRAQLNNSQFPIYSSDLLNESSSDNSDKNVSTILKPLRSYQSDLKIYGPKVKENIIKAVSVSPPKDKIVPLKVDLPRVEKIENSYADLERLLERIINKNFGRRFSPLRTVLSSKLLFTAALIGIVLLALLPVPVVFSFFDKSFDYVKDAINNSNTVLGFRPGTHENEILLLDAEGNIAIMGHIETGGQLKSSVADGIAPIVVDSKTLVKNLNAEFLGGASSTDFTLAFITKNGNVTTDDVKLEGSVEVGKTLIVRGATKLLSALEVGDKLKVFGDAEFTQALDVLGPAYFNSIVTLQEDLIVKGDIEALKNISVRGSVESGSAVIAKSGSFGSLGVTGSFSAGGKITLGDEEETLTVNSKNMTIDAKGNATFDSSVSAPFISATRFEVTNSTTTNAIITNSTTTNAFISSLTGNDLRIGSTATSTINSLGDLLVVGSTTLQNFTFVNATGTSATTTNLFSTTASSTNLFSALLNSGSATFQNLLVNSSSTLQNITFLNSTSTNATTTNFFTGWFTANQLQVGQTATTTINDLGDLFVVGSTTLQNFSFLNATGTQATSTNLFSSTLTGNSLAIGSTATSTINSSGDLLVVGSTTLQNFTFINATGTSATTTNFFSTTASSTNLFFTTANGGNLTSTGLGTFANLLLNGSTTLQNFTFVNATGTHATTTGSFASSYFYASDANATSTFTGNVFIEGLTVSNDVSLGDDASDIISFVASVGSNILPDANNTRNLGSGSLRWATGYFDTVDATTLSGTVSGGSTSANTWTINSDNATNNAEVGSLAFETGTATFNANLNWNAAGDAGRVSGYDNTFLTNYPIAIYSEVSGANQTFTSGSLFKYGQNATHAITQSGAFTGAEIDFSSNITVPDSSSGNQTGVKVTLKDGGASATTRGFELAGTSDYGLYIDGETQNYLSGNLGIGTTTPYAKLSVWGANTTSGVRAFEIVDSASTTNFYIDNAGLTSLKNLLATSSTTLQNFTFNTATGTSATTTNFFSTTASSTNLFSASGSLGSVTVQALTATRVPFAGTGGLLSDDSDLTFSTDTLSATKLLAPTSVSTPSLISTGAITATPAAGENFNIVLSTTGDFIVNTDNLVVDTSSGFTGIGTTTPYAKLSVWGANTTSGVRAFEIVDSASTTNFYIDNAGLTSLKNLLATSSTTLQNFTFNTATGTSATTTNFFSTTASSTNLYSSLLTVGGTGLVVDSSRNVGIGTTTPYAKLSVWGANTTSGVRAFEIVDSASTTNFYIDNAGLTSLKNLLATSSTTLQNFTFVNATGTSATTTNFFSTIASSTNLFFTTGSGGNFTSTGLGTFANLLINSSSTLQNFTFVNATGTSATTTNFFSTTASSTNLYSSLLTVGGTGLVVDSSRNVGIGKTPEQAKLEVTGTNDGTKSLLLGSGDTGGFPANSYQILFGYNGGDDYMQNIRTRHNSGADSGNAIDFYTWDFGTDAQTTPGTLHAMTIEAGNVGIGHTSPSEKLNVQGTVAAKIFTATSTTATSTFAGGLAIETSGLVYDFSSNNVGIGTTGPGAKLDITGLQADGVSSVANGLLFTNNTSGAGPWGHAGIWTVGSSGFRGDLVFGTDDDGSNNINVLERMRIKSNGNVGIGTTTPTWLLNPTSATASQLALSSGAGFAQWAFRNAGGNLYFATTTVAGTATTSTSALTIIGSSGNVGIGTTGPVSRMDVLSTAASDGLSLRNSSALGTASGGIVLELTTLTPNAADQRLGLLGFGGVETGTTNVAGAGVSGWSGAAWGSGDTPGYLRFETTPDATSGRLERMRIDMNGNVGIGDTSPDYTLELSGATAPKLALSDTGLAHGVTTYAQTDTFFSVEQVTDNDGGARIWGFSDSVGQNPLRLIGAFGNTNPTDTVPALWLLGAKKDGATGLTTLADAETLLAISNNGTDKMTVLGSGNVGIGTTGPGYTLDVRGGNGQGIRWTDTANSVQNFVGSFNSVGIVGTLSNHNLQLYTNNTPKVTIQADGNVGIGTTAPLDLLSLKASVTSNLKLEGGHTAALSTVGQIGFAFTPRGGTSANINIAQIGADTTATDSTSGGRLTFDTRATSGSMVEHMRIEYDGTIFMYTLGTSGGNRTICGDATNEDITMENSSTCGVSSIRFKENVAPLGYGLDEILALNPVSFRYKEEYDALDRRTKLGFIAEDMELIIPELVNYDENGLAYNIDYPYLTSVIVKGIQELNSKVDNLESMLAATSTSSESSEEESPSWFESIWEMTLARLNNFGVTIAQAFTRVNNLFADTLHIENQLCVDDVCISKENLKNLLVQYGGTSVSALTSEGGSINNQQPTTNNDESSTEESPVVSEAASAEGSGEPTEESKEIPEEITEEVITEEVVEEEPFDEESIPEETTITADASVEEETVTKPVPELVEEPAPETP